MRLTELSVRLALPIHLLLEPDQVRDVLLRHEEFGRAEHFPYEPLMVLACNFFRLPSKKLV